MQYHQNTNEDLALASRLQRQDTFRFFLHVLQDDSSAMPFKKLSRSEKSAWMADASELGALLTSHPRRTHIRMRGMNFGIVVDWQWQASCRMGLCGELRNFTAKVSLQDPRGRGPGRK